MGCSRSHHFSDMNCLCCRPFPTLLELKLHYMLCAFTTELLPLRWNNTCYA